MGSFYDVLTDKQIDFIARQHMFFTATAHASGRINCSPKGMDTFRVLAPDDVAYLDLTGSGNETRAHLQHDGRITIMMCSFDQKPNTLRIYGRGRVISPADAEWNALIPWFNEIRGQRHIVRIAVESTQDPCGYAVPRYSFLNPRNTLVRYREGQTDDAIADKIASNTQSIDGLPIEV